MAAPLPPAAACAPCNATASGSPSTLLLDPTPQQIALAFGLTLAAAGSTCLGAAAVWVANLASPLLLAAALGASAGVMVYVSLVEIVHKSADAFRAAGSNPAEAYRWATLSFFAGVAAIWAIDRFVLTRFVAWAGRRARERRLRVEAAEAGRGEDQQQEQQPPPHTPPRTPPPPPPVGAAAASVAAAAARDLAQLPGEGGSGGGGGRCGGCRRGRDAEDEEEEEDQEGAGDNDGGGKDTATAAALGATLARFRRGDNDGDNDDDKKRGQMAATETDMVAATATAAEGEEEAEREPRPRPPAVAGSPASAAAALAATALAARPRRRIVALWPFANQQQQQLRRRRQEQQQQLSPGAADDVEGGSGGGGGGGGASPPRGAAATPPPPAALAPATASAPASGPSPDDLGRIGLTAGLALAVHNAPEGLATFVGALASPGAGFAVAVAIILHNLPEGMVVALPVAYATRSRWRGFLWGCVPAIAEPIGALIGYGIVRSSSSGTDGAAGGGAQALVYGLMFGAVAGIMTFLSVHELLPAALRNDPRDRVATMSFLLGAAVIAASLLLFQA